MSYPEYMTVALSPVETALQRFTKAYMTKSQLNW